MEKKLRESEEKFHKAFYYSPIAMSITSMSDSTFIELNDEFLRTIEYSREEITGRTAIEMGLWVDPAQRTRLIDLIRREGRAKNVLLDVRTRSGKVLPMLWSAEIVSINNSPCLLASAVEFNKYADYAKKEASFRPGVTQLSN